MVELNDACRPFSPCTESMITTYSSGLSTLNGLWTVEPVTQESFGTPPGAWQCSAGATLGVLRADIYSDGACAVFDSTRDMTITIAFSVAYNQSFDTTTARFRILTSNKFDTTPHPFDISQSVSGRVACTEVWNFTNTLGAPNCAAGQLQHAYGGTATVTPQFA